MIAITTSNSTSVKPDRRSVAFDLSGYDRNISNDLVKPNPLQRMTHRSCLTCDASHYIRTATAPNIA
jgi:hypothetical protein